MAETALITGASSGIGAEFARLLAKVGASLVLVARRADRLEALAAELREAHGVRVEVVPADLAREGAVRELFDEVARRGLVVDLLINNAGLGHHGAFAEESEAVDRKLIDLNITALTAMTRAFLPGMIDRRRGGIINVASTAAFQPIPYFAVYAASKAYVLSFSEALAEEVAPHGIKVLCLCPGATETEFVAQAQFKSDVPTKAPMMSARDVAVEGLRALRQGRALAIPGLLNVVQAIAPRFAPRAIVTKVSAAIFKPTKK